jgi:Transcriptional regulator, AbiEi antitoxin
MKGASLGVCRLVVAMRPEDGKASTDETIAGLAASAHGVVARRELLRAGITPEQIKRRLARGSLISVHRGVYRVGHRAPNREAHYMAAVKACGDRAVLCGRAAAHLWRLAKGSPPPPEVLAPAKRLVPGVITHRSWTASTDIAHWRGIPLTSIPRTLVDLASSLPEPALARACHEAGVLHRTTPAQVDAVLRRLPSAPGRAKLERVLHGEVRVTLSRLEAAFLRRLKEAGLPLPITNRVAGGHRVDCRWPENRLTVELDSYRFHNSHHSWNKDRLREREARARSDEFRRYSWSDIFEDPQFMLSELSELLGVAEFGSL